MLSAMPANKEYPQNFDEEDEQSLQENEQSPQPKPRFPLGRMVATPGALVAIAEAGREPVEFLRRHEVGDWGEVGEEDAAENELSVEKGFRIMSVYILPETGVKIWLISEADRSATTILMPSEY